MKVMISSLRKKNKKAALHVKRKLRVRKKVTGDAARPRLSVFRSAKHIYVQAINDQEGKTLAAASTLDSEMKTKGGQKKVASALVVGSLIAKRLVEKGVKTVVFDRNGFRYKGRIAAIAQGARDGGLEF